MENRREQDKKKKTQAVSLRVENDELNKQFSKYELHTEAAGLAQDLRRKIDGNEWKYCE